MPLAEAIILGRPVLANDLPVMREIGGNWPIYRCLRSEEDICQAILEMADAGLQATTAELPPALKDWSWREIAIEYETIFNQALVKHRVCRVVE